MFPIDATRRAFLGSGAALAGSSLLRFTIPGIAMLARAAHAQRQAGAELRVLTKPEARELEAIAARILPTTDTPGAREAGVIWFFDQTFLTFNAPRLAAVQSGLKAFLESVPDGRPFSELSEATQDAYLKSREDTEFFALCRLMTVCGFFGMSRYGGNRGDVGWKLIGMSPHPQAHSSPFGYYDAAYLREHPDG